MAKKMKGNEPENQTVDVGVQNLISSQSTSVQKFEVKLHKPAVLDCTFSHRSDIRSSLAVYILLLGSHFRR